MTNEVWSKVKNIGWQVTENDCFVYNGYKNEHGYGQIRQGKLIRVHRLAYHILVEPITDKDVILHLCDNPPCLNVNHLKKGTQSENMKDMWQKGRAFKSGLTTCPNGHDYPKNRPRGINKNRCRECANERNRRYYERKKYGLATS